MALLGCSRVHTVPRETRQVRGLIPKMDTYPRTRALSGRRTARSKKVRSDGVARSSCCLRLQLLGIKCLSFLPNTQGYRGDLARQRQPGHRRHHPFLENGPSRMLAVVAAPLNRFFIWWLWFQFSPRMSTGLVRRTN